MLSGSGAEGRGHLVFSDSTGGTYNSLYFENHNVSRLDIFDSGLQLAYVADENPSLSPNEMYFFANLTEDGVLEDALMLRSKTISVLIYSDV
jgi:hypothetical protein